MEKCKVICYRNLFKRVALILESSQLSIKTFFKALKLLGVLMEATEIECILANMIYKGYIRGYIAHEKGVLVLSKRDPFPIAAVMSPQEVE